ncbi:bifunctional diguanylate cyclase/phosphodiesterase [Marinobacterium lutimaris]|uniref:PAS domain S-box-containing protein/diguanylate cyclase (GGDEF) domain-containing protein n=1 Tax=Marinobacterium lutimaris TaxID=568106 RepID=A0A1H5YEN1_9GAMM|nr:EAL domain-containing protein [Marinobacterium lutimaris]SEG22087.1 PAS domain S-box-containing protein/diguanylate cyclase (GGDEF) domain-containing protein [Marinobacterium lutimaris]
MIWTRISLLPLTGFALIISFLLVFAVFHQIGEERARSSISETTEVLAHSLEGGTVRSIQDIQGRLNSLRVQLGYEPEMLFRPLELTRRLAGLIDMSPQLRELAVVTPAGLVLASSVPDSTGAQISGVSCLSEQYAGLPILFGRPISGRSLTSPLASSGIYQLPVCLPLLNEKREPVAWLVAIWNPDSVREQFRPLIESLPASVALYRYDGVLLVASRNSDDLPGISHSGAEPFVSRLSEKEWGAFTRIEDGREYLETFRSTSMFPVVISLKYDMTEGLASWRKLTERLSWLVAGIVLIICAVTTLLWGMARRQAKMADRLQLLGTAISTTANAVIITDRNGFIEWVNEAFTRLSGYRQEQVQGLRPSILNSGEHNRFFFRTLWETISSGAVWRGEVVNLTRDGRRLIVDQTITPITDEQGLISHYVAVHEDVTARREAEQRELFLAFHDQLTELPNRRKLMESLGEILSAQSGSDVGLLYLDLDNFKTVNDTLGHLEGDKLLVITVKRLVNAISADVLLARLGGDEFALVVSQSVSKHGLEELAARLIKVLARPVDLNGSRFQLTASVGIALGQSGETEPATLLRQADLAMYKAKHDGRNLYRFFDQQMDYLMQRRVDLEQGLRVAVENGDQLSVRYQPIFDTRTRKPLGAEVLMRWQNEAGEWVSPAEFISVAEESGMIVELGAWQMDTVIAQLAKWDRAGLDVRYLSLNISAVQLARDDIAGRLLATLARHGIGTHRIIVEITETTLMSKSPMVRTNLSALEVAGILVSIDDFGTGYSSLSYLKQLQADYLKIDRSFVIGIGKNRSDEEIIYAMLAVARSLQMKVVAEGVDDEVQLRFLQDAGCDLTQGFLLSKPLLAEEAAALFAAASCEAALGV